MPPIPSLPAATGRPFDLLDGIRILDLTSSIAGPYSTMLLADMGAEVIKLERPGQGDDARGWGPPFLDGDGMLFLGVNRNKRSLALDLTGDEGKAVLAELIAACDVFVTNQLPRVQSKLGTDYETVLGINPKIIFGSLTGFGLTGARRDMVSYDLIAEGYSSIMDMTGERDGAAQKVGTPASDLLAGMDMAFAIAAALRDKEATGRGHLLDISMIESSTRFMSPIIMTYLGSGNVPRRSGARESVIAIYQTFDTADDPITLGLPNENIWQRFWNAVGHPEMLDDPNYADNAKRRAARAKLVVQIQDILLQRGRADWLALFTENSIPAGPINQIDEVVADEGLLERGFFYAMHPEGREAIPQVNTGIRVDDKPNAPRTPPPALGADGAAVLRDVLGKSEDEIARLNAAKII